eukprot:gene14178-19024_t
MKFSYRLKRVCGNVYGNGKLEFTSDGNSILSPVGNLVTVVDLVAQSCSTLPFENRKDIKNIAVSNNGLFLVTVDMDGHGLFINLPRQVILQRFNFKHIVRDIKFSPNDELFAVTCGHNCQIWKTPNTQKQFSPLILTRTIGSHHDDTVSVDWSSDSESIIIGSKDLSARIFYRINSKKMSKTILSGHRDKLVGGYFAESNEQAYTIARDGAVFTWNFIIDDSLPLPTWTESDNLSDEKDEMNEDNTESEDDSDSDSNSFQNRPIRKPSNKPVHKRRGHWLLGAREFLWDPHTVVTSSAFNKSSKLLVIGFSSGVFGLYEMPGCVNIHRLSVSNHSINSVSINKTGEWLAIGSAELGQLLVWEWQSETYVIKQQGHLYGLNSMDFSSDGQLIATGGEDSKVKIWNCGSGFCFITFTDHTAPVTGVKFTGKGSGKALISASLDGTVRAYDLLRYKNFRTLTTPNPVQFTCLAVDVSGEVICAGALDPFNIYVWSLQTGRLLDVLAGHEGPIACLDFSNQNGILASGSWDGTCKLWDVYKNNCVETLEHGCDVLAVAFRPDSKEIATASTNGNITFWDVENGSQLSIIEGRRDISGGRLTTDTMTSINSAKSKYFNSLSYTADGSCILAGGRSKFCCIYAIATGVLIKKFQLSHNRSLEGILDELHSGRIVDGVEVENLNIENSDDDSPNQTNSNHPGAGKSNLNDGSRTTRPEVATSALCFSPTGREWAVASTQGLQVFSLDDAMLFAPTDLDIAITPQAIENSFNREEYGLAINMALHLGERELIKKAFDSVPMDSIELVVKSVDPRMMKDALKFIAEELVYSRHIEYYLRWCWEMLRIFGNVLQSNSLSMMHMESVRALIRAISVHEKEILKMADENLFSLGFIAQQTVTDNKPAFLDQNEKELDDIDEMDSEENKLAEINSELNKSILRFSANEEDNASQQDEVFHASILQPLEISDEEDKPKQKNKKRKSSSITDLKIEVDPIVVVPQNVLVSDDSTDKSSDSNNIIAIPIPSDEVASSKRKKRVSFGTPLAQEKLIERAPNAARRISHGGGNYGTASYKSQFSSFQNQQNGNGKNKTNPKKNKNKNGRRWSS